MMLVSGVSFAGDSVEIDFGKALDGAPPLVGEIVERNGELNVVLKNVSKNHVAVSTNSQSHSFRYIRKSGEKIEGRAGMITAEIVGFEHEILVPSGQGSGHYNSTGIAKFRSRQSLMWPWHYSGEFEYWEASYHYGGLFPPATDYIDFYVIVRMAVPSEIRLPERRSIGQPEAAKQVAVTSKEYAGTDVHHMVYLPTDWYPDVAKLEPEERWPVIVEYTGNHFPAAGSTGKVEDAGLGFGISGGRFIWITLPFVSQDHQSNADTWWGDVAATVEYAKVNVPRICAEYGGNPKQVLLCGFSRGAIATNFIGLHDDEIAKLWCGFITHDHYDGVREWSGTTWGAPLDRYRTEAAERLNRLNGRPVLVCQEVSSKVTADYLKPLIAAETFTFLDVDMGKIFAKFPNDLAVHPHNDRWLLKDSPERKKVWEWVDGVIEKPREK